MIPIVILNDGETFTNIHNTFIVDAHGVAYDLTQLWDRIPIQIRELCCVGDARQHTKLEKLMSEGCWP